MIDKAKRTLAIVNRLADGHRLTLPDGNILAMGEDMSIGFIIKFPDQEEGISMMSTMDLKGLNELLNKHNIGITHSKI